MQEQDTGHPSPLKQGGLKACLVRKRFSGQQGGFSVCFPWPEYAMPELCNVLYVVASVEHSSPGTVDATFVANWLTCRPPLIQ